MNTKPSSVMLQPGVLIILCTSSCYKSLFDKLFTYKKSFDFYSVVAVLELLCFQLFPAHAIYFGFSYLKSQLYSLFINGLKETCLNSYFFATPDFNL